MEQKQITEQEMEQQMRPMPLKALQAPLSELAEYDEIERKLKADKPVCLGISGCVDTQKLHMVHGLGEHFKYRLLITTDERNMRAQYEDYRFFDKAVCMFPAKDLIFYQADIHGNQLTRERLKVLRMILEDRPLTVITTIDALMMPFLPLEKFSESVIPIRKNEFVDMEKLKEKLVYLGYEKAYQVSAPGQFSIRGDIIDIFDLTEENPVRIELWGDDVESIRSFDVTSQRSIEALEEITIYPGTELLLTEDQKYRGIHLIDIEAKKHAETLRESGAIEEAARILKQAAQLREETLNLMMTTNLESYLPYFYEEGIKSFLQCFAPKDTCIFLDDPVRVGEHGQVVETEFRESMSHRLKKGYILPRQIEILTGMESVLGKMEAYHRVTLSTLDTKSTLVKPEKKYAFSVQSVSPYNNSFDMLVHDLKRYKKQGYRVLLLSASRKRAERLAEDLRDFEINANYTESRDKEIVQGEVMTFYGRISKGFEYIFQKFVVISESDIFGSERKKKKQKKFHEGQKLLDFAELKVGDYVVHESYGMAIYRGIEKIEREHVVKDYLKLEYKGGNLYILATNLHVIQKYASGDAEGKKPKLNRLGGQEWAKTKEKTRMAVEEVAEDLVQLYAARQEKQGYCFGPDTTWQQEFEEMFPFEETDDQKLAIDATKQDMESTKIMDRLICGDVGYGKTEIAIRAAFKAVQDNKQVIFLVPTTLLAQQHYTTFVQRMKDFPISVELLSRFRTPKEQKKTIENLRKGYVDIVIGTHRLLSKDVTFKNLGLLIIDEEQRFGVSHKEKIKQMRENVDVLTLTATPIPRTLHMGLIGIRDMSVLEEAPGDRRPVQTFVCEYNEEMVREAINRELVRDGQVFYLYNRVNDIAEVTARIQQLVPDATVAFAHGKMNETQLEKIMYEFINGEIDVLVSTTIIETGLDIPNANTIIIHDSDTMGLSQLYQLRGRVGRSNRNAYAFMMYRRDKQLKEVAEKRLAAIREFTDLGSGFKISMRDLEIRGAGTLLGRAQSGHMAAVGYDLYCKMLSEAVKRVRGEKIKEDFVTIIDLDVDAYVPPTYIVNEFQKLDIYKRIAGIETPAEYEDMKEELLDRFGQIPKSADNLLRIAVIRMQAHRLYVTEVKGKNEMLTVTLRSDAKLNPEGIPGLMKKYNQHLNFSSKGIPEFSITYKRCGLAEKDEEQLLQMTEKLLGHMEEFLSISAEEQSEVPTKDPV